MSVAHSLNAEELRVLACLMEKSYTTPDQYPLSTNALVTACNQKTSRDPVVDYSAQLVDGTLQLLRDAGWVRMIRASGNRAFKHRHVMDEKLGLTDQQQAVLSVLALRGAQSPGELKTRTERYHPFADLDEVEQVLGELAGRETPLVRNVGRASGQSQDRWVQLLGPAEDHEAAATAPQPVADSAAGVGGSTPHPQPQPQPHMQPQTHPEPAAAALERRVAELEERLTALEQALGMDGGDG
ncbi:MAG: YceH family protein [Actinomycetota bacterium]